MVGLAGFLSRSFRMQSFRLQSFRLQSSRLQSFRLQAPRWHGLRPGQYWLGLMLLACSQAPPAAPPATAVQSFYAAVAAGDCAAALDGLAAGLRTRVAPDGACETLFAELRRHPLERVVATAVDGRHRAAQLVRTRLRGRATEVIIRVEAEGTQWKISSL